MVRLRTVATPSAGRITVIVLVVAMAAMWVYVVYLAVGPGRQPPPDRLADPAFAVAAQRRCAAAQAIVGQLPTANVSETASEQAAVVERANDVFVAMLEDLDTLVPPTGEGRLVEAWLADWRIYLDDRERYADALRSDPDARLLVSAKDREQITEFIDAFAADNRMPACATPLDVG